MHRSGCSVLPELTDKMNRYENNRSNQNNIRDQDRSEDCPEITEKLVIRP